MPIKPSVLALGLVSFMSSSQAFADHRDDGGSRDEDLTCRGISEAFAQAVDDTLGGVGDPRGVQALGAQLQRCVRNTLDVLVPRPAPIPLSISGPQLFWYQNGLQLAGAQTVAAGIATGQWGYWGVYVGTAGGPVRTGALTVRSNCQSDEVAVGMPPSNPTLYCAKLNPGFITANPVTLNGTWTFNIRYSCPAGKALVGFNFANTTFTYTCADILRRPF